MIVAVDIPCEVAEQAVIQPTRLADMLRYDVIDEYLIRHYGRSPIIVIYEADGYPCRAVFEFSSTDEAVLFRLKYQ